MRISNLFAAMILGVAATPASAQDSTPKGYTSGHIVLANGSVEKGLVKDDIRSSASIQFIQPSTGKKTKYNGMDILGAAIDTVQYLCIRGDFFRIICKGEISFLQKLSQAAGKTFYNGVEPVMITGTEGKPGDYFFYSNQQLVLVNKKNMEEVIGKTFKNDASAAGYAKSVNGEMLQLKELVNQYNQSHSN